MMHFTDITGLAGVLLAVVVLALRLPVVARLPFHHRAWLAGALLIALTIPFAALSGAEFVRGISGDLSITTLLLLGLALRGVPDRQHGLLVCVAGAAFVLYPFALGLGMFDSYRLGFGNLWFVAWLLLLVLAAWVWQYTLVVGGVSLAVLAWSVGWYESGNLWDYLLDPWLSIYALAVLAKRGISLRGKRSV
ncbi:MAG: hypothetical protein EPO42_06675 [Gallionellaceae bacterium]|nr:MAG: hypothetical protein EPO42_06675 [Gallionellaceae bacterium]